VTSWASVADVPTSRAEVFEDAFFADPTAQAIVETGPSRRLVAVNHAFAGLLGYAPEELERRPVTDLLPRDAVAAFGAALDRLGAGASPREVLGARWLRADGAQCAADALLVVRPRGAAAPRHALVRLDEGLAGATSAGSRGGRKLLQDIIDNVPALVFIKDLHGRYLLANRLTRERYGPCVGQTAADIASPDEAQQFGVHDAAVLAAGEPREFEETTVHAGRLHTYLSLKFPLFDRHGRVYGLCGVSTDVTALKRAETVARDARDEAERANRAKSDFLSRVSHELRTPLHSILGYGQLLEAEELQPHVATTVRRIASAGRHLLDLINDLLDVSRIEQGEYRMTITTVHAAEPASEVCDIMRPLAAARRVELALDMHAGLHVFVTADQRRLQQVLLNLIANGINYSHAGGEVRVSFRAAGATHLRFLVEDTGRGIARSDFERVFVPFERLADDDGQLEGVGLGLAVSKAFAEAMGGSIGIERSEPGRGTTFYVELPVAEPPENAHELVLGTVAPDQPMEAPPRGRVLYIEDYAANVELIEQTLRQAGDVDLVSAARGDTGLRLAAQLRPDLILLDLHLPDIDGEQVLARLKADPATAAIPVVVVSADATPGLVRRLKESGAAVYLTKPLDLGAFVRTVAEQLSR
jgi:PAS domain S-box-containing protein